MSLAEAAVAITGIRGAVIFFCVVVLCRTLGDIAETLLSSLIRVKERPPQWFYEGPMPQLKTTKKESKETKDD